jgi:tRNA modification GTPase
VTGDTIVAASTSLAGAARAMVRLSGPRAHELARLAAAEGGWGGAEALLMEAPRTYTREPMAEIRLPACAPLVEELVERLAAAGARVAGPGEFTWRAFVHGRIDLARAEAVLALIRARDDAERRGSLRALEGRLSERLASIEEGALDLCAEVEAGIDFVDQEIELIPADEAGRRAAELRSGLARLRADAAVQARREDEFRVLLFGRSGVGKSSLFNRLAPGADAIVSARPCGGGTTRDLLERRIELPGLEVPVALIDSAGVLERPDALEAEAVRRTHEAVKGADLVLHVRDASGRGPDGLEPRLEGVAVLAVANKCDLGQEGGGVGGLRVSARTGEGLEELRRAAAARLRQGLGAGEARYCITMRQAAALQAAEYLLAQAVEGARDGRGLEFVAADLRDAAGELGTVTGREVTDEVLRRIFSRFCIGK